MKLKEKMERIGAVIFRILKSGAYGIMFPPSLFAMRQSRKQVNPQTHQVLRKGLKAPFPKSLEPMLATKISQPFNDPAWLFEIKWDGYRIIAHVQQGKVILHSRSLQNYTNWYPAVTDELASRRNDMVLDGEIVVLNERGKPDFDALQKYQRGDHIVYYVFDLLWYNGYSLLHMPLEDRKMILESVLPENKVIKYSNHFDDGVALFEQVQKIELEGIVCKKRDSHYRPGFRTNEWLKLPAVKRQEFVIGGWTESGSGRAFRSLLFGAYENDKLINVGHAGSGYKEKNMVEILKQLKKLETRKNPFTNPVETDTKPHWVKPTLVAEFKYAGFTKSGKIRKPAIFIGFRKDKNARDVRIERPMTTKNGIEKKSTKATARGSNWPKIENEPITSREEVQIEDCVVELRNVEKKLWHDITKADLLQYYNSVAKYILPHVQNRPQSLHIKYHGPLAPGLYIKDMEGREPGCAEIFSVERKHKKPGKNSIIDYLVCNNRATLLWMINIGCIDINPWTSRTTNYLQPDFVVIDLDPSDDHFTKAIEAAKAAKQFFDENGLKAFVKTSGKTGIHIFLPCQGFGFPQARKIAVSICKEIHSLVPSITTIEVSVSMRGNKLYLDPNQNDEADTVAAPYSVRPYKIPSVSTPLEWKEVTDSLDSSAFLFNTVLQRLEKKGEIWNNILDKKVVIANSRMLSNFY
jgi:bifunctional non-homologous end joining protein LigD